MYLVVIIAGTASMWPPPRRLSNTLDADFCIDALEEASKKGRPGIFDTNQGAQFASDGFTSLLKRHGIRVSMDGKGWYSDNLFIERLWKTVQYEKVYLKVYQDGRDTRAGAGEYFRFHNCDRPHQTLGYRTPAEVFASIPVQANHGGMMEFLQATDPNPSTTPILS